MKQNGLKDRGETLMLFCVLSQSLWGLLQTTLIDVFYFSEEAGNRIRVFLVLLTMAYAIIYALWKVPKRFLATYLPIVMLLLITAFIFPQNLEYINSEAIKFTLPLVVPSFLCLTCVKDINRVEEIFLKVSWMCFGVALIYAYQIISRKYVFSNYSMSISFSLLLPTLVLYSHKNKISVIASVFLFLLIVALGSRSAAIAIVVYVTIDMLFFNRKYFIPVVLVASLFVGYMGFFTNTLERYDITSRTIYLMESEEGLIGHLSNRDEVYKICLNKLNDNPVLGVGLYGDRLFLHGSTSHNFFIEVLLDFGYILGTIVILALLFYYMKTFMYADKRERVYFLRYFIATMIPLMVSGSYLKDYNLGVSLGICFLLNHPNKVTRLSCT